MMIKKNTVLVLSILLPAIFSTALIYAPGSASGDYEYLTQTLDNAKEFTLEVFEAMPAEDYDYRPADSVRTFGAQAFHIAYSLEWFTARLKGTPIQWEPGDENRMTKSELKKYTAEQFDSFIETIMNSEESDPFTAGIMSVLRHNSHHRGQMVSYIRTHGLVPPSYR